MSIRKETKLTDNKSRIFFILDNNKISLSPAIRARHLLENKTDIDTKRLSLYFSQDFPQFSPVAFLLNRVCTQSIVC